MHHYGHSSILHSQDDKPERKDEQDKSYLERIITLRNFSQTHETYLRGRPRKSGFSEFRDGFGFSNVGSVQEFVIWICEGGREYGLTDMTAGGKTCWLKVFAGSINQLRLCN